MVTQLTAIYFLWLATEKQPSEATLRGHEYFFYDLAQSGGEPIVSNSDEISMFFKTRQATGILFYTGALFFTSLTITPVEYIRQDSNTIRF